VGLIFALQKLGGLKIFICLNFSSQKKFKIKMRTTLEDTTKMVSNNTQQLTPVKKILKVNLCMGNSANKENSFKKPNVALISASKNIRKTHHFGSGHLRKAPFKATLK
jgi:hypothetical protein